MATLMELYDIEANAKSPPPVPPATEDPVITLSRDLLKKIRSAGLRAAETILDDPADPSGNTEMLQNIAWARQTIQYPDGSADALLRLSLADAPPAATVNGILTASEAQIQNTVNKMVPKLSTGLQVSQR